MNRNRDCFGELKTFSTNPTSFNSYDYIMNVDGTVFRGNSFIIGFSLPISQRVPVNPGAQLQLNPFTRSVHVPPLRQGLLAHSSTSILNEKGMMMLTVNDIVENQVRDLISSDNMLLDRVSNWFIPR